MGLTARPHSLIIILSLLHTYVFSQHEVSVIHGNKTTETGVIKHWRPDPNDPILKIKTRDEKGLIHAQDLEKLVFKRYVTGKKINRDQEENFIYQLPIEKQVNRNTSQKIIEKNAGVVIRSGEGQEYSNINPADPSIAVGPNHVIQMINGPNGSARFTVYDKTGNILIPSSYMDQLPGSSYNGGGDCIAFYDQLSDRFVMTEFGDTSRTGVQMNSLIMAVSASNDPTGSWYVYEFYTGFFPDYPKFGNWHDAWYGVTRDFTDKYEGNSVWAFDKDAMIMGSTIIRAQRIRLNDADNRYNSLVPVTLGGMNPASTGSPGLFLYYNDDELTASPNDKDSLTLLGFSINFNNPTSSILSKEGSFVVPPFISDYCISRNCIPSPGPQGYDAVSNRIMHKPMFRNFGTHQSIVANHTVDANGNGLSGIRWYELRKTGSWAIHQQNTFAPQELLNCNASNEKHRFMGSIMMNGAGQILLAYNYSGKSDFASLAFTGRSKESPLNTMDLEEEIIIKGKNYGTDGNRWGDYNDMAPDPANDSLFWFSGMYGKDVAAWGTSISVLQIRKNPDRDVKITGIVSPNQCISACEQSSNPKIKIRNNGNDIIRSLIIKMAVNGIEVAPFSWNGILNSGEEMIVILPPVNFQNGNNTLEFILDKPNGLNDQKPENNTIRGNFLIQPPSVLPFVENISSTLMPPAGWSNVTNGSSALTWQNTNKAFFEGGRSFLFDNYNNNERGRSGTLVSPLIETENMDSLSLGFMLAAGIYDLNSIDTFEVSVSTDCGKSFQSVLKKWGSALGTRPGFTTSEFIPLQSEWRNETIDLSAYRNKKITIAFKVTNDHGNNIYLDNIEVKGFVFPLRDVKTQSIISPFLFGCNNLITPSVQFINAGKDTIINTEFNLWINSQLKEKKMWSGKLARNKTGALAFSPLSVPSGNSSIMVSVSTVNGSSDQNVLNDTVTKNYQLLSATTLPFKESFNDKSLLLPWIVSGADSILSWRKAVAGSSDPGSMRSVNFNLPSYVASAYTPLFNPDKADSIFFSFDVAATLSAGVPDTLSIDLSTDCGNSWITVYKKWGVLLATRKTISTVSFTPQSIGDWRTEKIDLSPLLFGKENFMLRINNQGKGGNNIFLDQFRVDGLKLPDQLKKKGFLIYPNPSDKILYIRFYPYAVALKSIKVMDGSGKIVYHVSPPDVSNWQYWEIPTQLLAEGIYFVSLDLNGKIITERILVSHH
jgi:hypothetical protein